MPASRERSRIGSSTVVGSKKPKVAPAARPKPKPVSAKAVSSKALKKTKTLSTKPVTAKPVSTKPLSAKAKAAQAAANALVHAANDAPRAKPAAPIGVGSAPRSKPLSEAREKVYAELFGTAVPKGRLLSVEGEPFTEREADEAPFGIVQYGPRPGRFSWVYATTGVSQMRPENSRAQTQVEFAIFWKERDKLPAKLLGRAVRYVLETGHIPTPGQVLLSTETRRVGGTALPHWLVCATEGLQPKSKVNLLTLVGVSEAEVECAQRVNAEMADGRIVLQEALRSGGIFPLTDPRRPCLTRRRDFMRLWETAFRLVRERKLKGQ